MGAASSSRFASMGIASSFARENSSSPNRQLLFPYLKPISDRWFDIGIALGVDQIHGSVLRSLQTDGSSNNDKKLKQVLKLWSTGSTAKTWHEIIEVISGPPVGETTVAGKIETSLLEKDRDIESIYDVTPEKEDLKFVLRSMKGDSELLQLLSERLKLSPAVFSDINALIDHLYNKDDGDDITWGRAISILEENPPLVKKKLNGLSNINLASAVKEFISKNEIYIKYKSCVPVYSSALNNAIQTKGAVKVFFSKITVSGPPRSGRATIANRLLHEANLVKGICSESDSKFRVFHMKSPREVSTRSSLEESAHVNDATSQHVKHQERDNNKGEENPMMNPEEEPTMEEPSSGSTSEPKPTLEAEITVHELPKEEFVIDDIEGPTDIKPSSNNSPHLTEENSSLRSSFQKTTQSGQSPASRPNRFRNFAKVTNNLLKLRSETSAKRAVKSDDGDIQLIHIINSGGQPAFLDIAPALLRYTPVNILTCVLNDGLENKPKFDYIIGDECIEEPEEHRLTNLQLLESSFRSLASVSPHHPRGIHAKFSDKKPHFLIVGNQFDGMKKSNETLEDKDVVLWSTLGHYCDMELVINFDETREKIIFPLNAVEYTEQEIKMIQKIYNAIAKYNIEAEIPTHWFYFKTFLDEHEGSKKESIISKAECVKLGIEECQMKDETEVVHALMFFHDLTILSYFADILPDVVFLHPKPLLDKLSELICISFPKAISILQEKTGNCIPAGAHVNMKTKGIFKRNLLTSFLTEGFKDYFTADHFITLMQSLFVIAPLPGKDQYFLPSALPTATLKQNEKQPFTNNVEPLVLTWKLNPIPKGLFPALVINLLHHPEPLKFELLQSWPQYRNAIRLICKNIGGRILLVDDVVWFEIYYDGPVEECSKIRSVILDCIAKVVDNFHYVKSIKTPEECFRCHDNRDISGKAPEGKQAHLCSLNERKTMLTCHDHGVKRVNEKYQPWFSTEVSNITEEPDHVTLVRILASISSQWHEIGIALNVDNNTLERLMRSRESDVSKIGEVLKRWKDNPTERTHPYKWETVIDAIRGPIVGKVQVAEEIRRHVIKLSIKQT